MALCVGTSWWEQLYASDGRRGAGTAASYISRLMLTVPPQSGPGLIRNVCCCFTGFKNHNWKGIHRFIDAHLSSLINAFLKPGQHPDNQRLSGFFWVFFLAGPSSLCPNRPKTVTVR